MNYDAYKVKKKNLYHKRELEFLLQHHMNSNKVSYHANVETECNKMSMEMNMSMDLTKICAF
jgi:hypothetical protein